jgi:FkbM family methyltransferase
MSEVARFYADNMFHGYVEGLDMNPGSVIIDLGTYKGYTAKLLATLYPVSTIYSFEPMIDFYNEAVLECSTQKNINVLPFGLGNGNFDFYMDEQGDSTSMIIGNKSATGTKCVMRDFFEVLSEKNISEIDLLHINIEGGEYDLLDYIFSNSFHLRVRHLIVQFHYPSTVNDEKLHRYYDIMSQNHELIYDYRYVWVRWSRTPPRPTKVFIFANCQGEPLLQFIPREFNVTHRHNYRYIYSSVLDEEILSLLSTCDYFIYQPLSSTYPVYNTDNLKRYLKPTCKMISFPYIFCDAFTPLYKSKERDIAINGEYSLKGCDVFTYKNVAPILDLKLRGFSLEAIIAKYDANEIDFRYKERFESTIARLKEKECMTDVKVSQFIIDKHKKYRLFNYHNLDKGFEDYSRCNHPSNTLIIEYVNQILRLMGLPAISYEGREILNGTIYLTKYDLAYYNYEWATSDTERMDTIVKSLISEIYVL